MVVLHARLSPLAQFGHPLFQAVPSHAVSSLPTPTCPVFLYTLLFLDLVCMHKDTISCIGECVHTLTHTHTHTLSLTHAHSHTLTYTHSHTYKYAYRILCTNCMALRMSIRPLGQPFLTSAWCAFFFCVCRKCAKHSLNPTSCSPPLFNTESPPNCD